jgi:hypothetical protein
MVPELPTYTQVDQVEPPRTNPKRLVVIEGAAQAFKDV